MINKLKIKIERQHGRLELNSSVLKVTNPKNVLQRGYSYIESDEKKYVLTAESFDKLKSNKEILINFYDGKRKVIKS
jgi:exodeoxyribonuclease VII large subunit